MCLTSTASDSDLAGRNLIGSDYFGTVKLFIQLFQMRNYPLFHDSLAYLINPLSRFRSNSVI